MTRQEITVAHVRREMREDAQYREDVGAYRASREDAKAPLPATLEEALALGRSRSWPQRFRLLELKALAIHDTEIAAYFGRRRAASTSSTAVTDKDYSLPPGMSKTRALQLAGPGTHDDRVLFVVVMMELEAMVFGTLVPSKADASYLESRLAKARDEAMRLDSAERERNAKLDDEWNNQWKRAAKSTELLRSTANIRMDEAAAAGDEPAIARAWDEQWRDRLVDQAKERGEPMLRSDAGDGEIRDHWDNMWKRPATFTGARGNAAQPAMSARVDAADSEPAGWGNEWKRPSTSVEFLDRAKGFARLREPASGTAIGDVIEPTENEPRLDTSDADEPLLELQQRLAAPLHIGEGR